MSLQKKLFGGTVEEENPFWLKKMIVLGQGAPNKCKSLNNKKATCVALYSPEHGFCRIYPVPIDKTNQLNDWDIINVLVISSKTDSRKKSYKVFNCEDDWPNVKIEKVGRLKKEDAIKLLNSISTDSAKEIKSKKQNFGIINYDKLKFEVIPTKKKEEIDCNQKLMTDFRNKDYSEIGEYLGSQSDFPYTAKLIYKCKGTCDECSSKYKYHKQKIVEWGAYVWMLGDSKNKDYCSKLFENYHIDDPTWKKWILIGNMKHHPQSYIVVKVIRFKIN
jgi:hypothetical protein